MYATSDPNHHRRPSPRSQAGSRRRRTVFNLRRQALPTERLGPHVLYGHWIVSLTDAYSSGRGLEEHLSGYRLFLPQFASTPHGTCAEVGSRSDEPTMLHPCCTDRPHWMGRQIRSDQRRRESWRWGELHPQLAGFARVVALHSPEIPATSRCGNSGSRARSPPTPTYAPSERLAS